MSSYNRDHSQLRWDDYTSGRGGIQLNRGDGHAGRGSAQPALKIHKQVIGLISMPFGADLT